MVTTQYIMNLVLHLDQHLASFIAAYGNWVYGLLFLIIFAETGFVVTPFLPGDSLLFAAGTVTANSLGGLNIHALFILLTLASIAGNTVNYFAGRSIGPRLFSSSTSWFLNKNHLLKAHAFYEQYGAKTLIIARFLPVIRTFAPFVAGIGYMPFKSFSIYNVIGAFLWIGSLLYVSYLFGNIPVVQQHFSLVTLLIVGVSLLPLFIGYARKICKKAAI